MLARFACFFGFPASTTRRPSLFRRPQQREGGKEGLWNRSLPLAVCWKKRPDRGGQAFPVSGQCLKASGAT
jgi:hypothetical protein